MIQRSKIKLHNQKDTKYHRRRLRKSMTKAEVVLWSMIKGKQLGYKFRRQHGIGKFIVDFYCSELQLVVELDGGIHGEEETTKRDRRKEAYLTKLGFYIKRYRNEYILEAGEAVYEDLKKHCEHLPSFKPSPNPSLEGRGNTSQ